jgi:hypothetical protein
MTAVWAWAVARHGGRRYAQVVSKGPATSGGGFVAGFVTGNNPAVTTLRGVLPVIAGPALLMHLRTAATPLVGVGDISHR